jgi:uncharacterized protein (DUF1015 family)
MQLHPFKAYYPNSSLIASPELFFDEMSKEFLQFFQSGFFIKNDLSAIYIYEILFNHRLHTGIISGASISDFIQGKMIGHENTLAAKEQALLKLILLRKAMIKPVLLGYDAVPVLDELIAQIKSQNPPFFTIRLDEYEETHRLWQLSDPAQINIIRDYFRDYVPEVFIADGHHRTSTAVRLIQDGYMAGSDEDKSVLAAFFPFRDLEIYEFNRVVNVHTQMSTPVFIARLSKYLHIKPLKSGRKPKEKHCMTLYISRQWYALTWRKEVVEKMGLSDVVLDTELFNHYIIHKILKIADIRSEAGIQYIEGHKGINGVEKAVHNNEQCAGFCLFPISVEEMKTASKAGRVLPPKSTWFEPRMKNGILVKTF